MNKNRMIFPTAISLMMGNAYSANWSSDSHSQGALAERRRGTVRKVVKDNNRCGFGLKQLGCDEILFILQYFSFVGKFIQQE